MYVKSATEKIKLKLIVSSISVFVDKEREKRKRKKLAHNIKRYDNLRQLNCPNLIFK